MNRRRVEGKKEPQMIETIRNFLLKVEMAQF